MTRLSASSGASWVCHGVYDSTIRSALGSAMSPLCPPPASSTFSLRCEPYVPSVSPPPPFVTKTYEMPAADARFSASRPCSDHSRPYLKTPSMSKAIAARRAISVTLGAVREQFLR